MKLRLWPSWLALAFVASSCEGETTELESSSIDADVVVDAETSGRSDAAAQDIGALDLGPALGAVGDACHLTDECASRDRGYRGLDPAPCIESWPGGYCIDYCTAPEGGLIDDALPRADCPAGAVCVPRLGSGFIPPDPSGVCLKECTTDADCRIDANLPSPAYFCRRTFAPFDPNAVIHENGYCAPIHCQSRGCPTSFRCDC